MRWRLTDVGLMQHLHGGGLPTWRRFTAMVAVNLRGGLPTWWRFTYVMAVNLRGGKPTYDVTLMENDDSLSSFSLKLIGKSEYDGG